MKSKADHILLLRALITTLREGGTIHGITALSGDLEELLIILSENDDGVRQYYGGPDNPYEAIKVIEAWKLNFNIGTVVKYLSRYNHKDPTRKVEDLIKARWYLDREIQNLKSLDTFYKEASAKS